VVLPAPAGPAMRMRRPPEGREAPAARTGERRRRRRAVWRCGWMERGGSVSPIVVSSRPRPPENLPLSLSLPGSRPCQALVLDVQDTRAFQHLTCQQQQHARRDRARGDQARGTTAVVLGQAAGRRRPGRQCGVGGQEGVPACRLRAGRARRGGGRRRVGHGAMKAMERSGEERASKREKEERCFTPPLFSRAPHKHTHHVHRPARGPEGTGPVPVPPLPEARPVVGRQPGAVLDGGERGDEGEKRRGPRTHAHAAAAPFPACDDDGGDKGVCPCKSRHRRGGRKGAGSEEGARRRARRAAVVCRPTPTLSPHAPLTHTPLLSTHATGRKDPGRV